MEYKKDMLAVLPIERVRKYRRKANDYKKAYRALDNPADGATSEARDYSNIEKFRKAAKNHRCTEHQDTKFLKEN